MKTIVGSFKHLIPYGGEDEEFHLVLKVDSLHATATVIETGEVLDHRFDCISVTLDKDAAIPAGTSIPGSDELDPSAAWEVRVQNAMYGLIYDKTHYVVGDSPIDVTKLPTKGDVDAAALEERIEQGKREREEDRDRRAEARRASETPQPPLPATRKPGTIYGGFYASFINCPPPGEPYSPPVKGSTPAKVSFVLPFRAVVRGVSIFVEEPSPGIYVTITLRDESGKEHVARINASQRGRSVGYFKETLDLKVGEYTMSWIADLNIKVRAVVVDEFLQERHLLLAYFSA